MMWARPEPTRGGPVLDLTDEGKLVEHVVEGALMVQSAIDGLEGFTPEICGIAFYMPSSLTMEHWNVAPRSCPRHWRRWHCTLHHSDWLDGDIRGFLDAVESEPLSGSGWTGYSKMFRTQLYPSPVEPPEEPDEEDETSS